jgi:hypothetical protein
LFKKSSQGNDLAMRLGAWLRAPWASIFAAFLCVAMSACSNDADQPAASSNNTNATTTAAQINSAPPAPWAVPQHASSQGAGNAATQPGLPPDTVQTPPPPASQLGAAASDSLATPVIHTVD